MESLETIVEEFTKSAARYVEHEIGRRVEERLATARSALQGIAKMPPGKPRRSKKSARKAIRLKPGELGAGGKRRRHSTEFKMKVSEEARAKGTSVTAEKYAIDAGSLRQWMRGKSLGVLGSTGSVAP